MINIDSNEAILLKPIQEIRKAFRSELWQRLASLEKQSLQSRSVASYSKPTIRFLEEHAKNLCGALNEETIQALVLSCFTQGQEKGGLTDKVASDVCFELVEASRGKRFTANAETKFSTTIKLVLVSLWSQEMLVLPRGFSSIKLPNDQLNKIAENLPSEFLHKIIAVNPSSGLEFFGTISEKHRKNISNFWLRLILNTNWTRPENVIAEDIRELIKYSRGSKNAFLNRYYVVDFLSYVLSNHHELSQILQNVLSEINAVREEEKKKSAEEAQERRLERKNGNYANGNTKPLKPQPRKEVTQTRNLLSFSRCTNGSDETIESHIGTNITSYSLRRIFFSEDLNVEGHPFYSEIGQKEKKLVHTIDRTFKAFIKSIGIEKPSNYYLCLSLLLCYVSVYLPRFFRERDGNLNEFPSTFNDLTCAYYIARSEFLADLMESEKEAPLTFFKFVEMISEKFEWNWNSTTYLHLKNAYRYFKYIEGANTVIPNSEQFKNSISDSDIPTTSRRTTTVKNVLPREYFQLFLSLLETLEYFVDHINGMADSVNPAIVGEKIVETNFHSLTGAKDFQRLWGNGGQTTPEVDVSVLNYTPVVRYEGKYYPLKKMMRFYTLTPYQVNGNMERRATPHVPRILWLMANTGIRQQHLLWLDKDSFDAAIPAKPTSLSPLIVSTDKAHAEWVSIVSKEVIEVCQCQKAWLERNEIISLKEPMWYSEIQRSRFGKFIPLFRLDASSSVWFIHQEVGKIMWMLEKFIRHQLGDVDCPRLAYWKPKNTEKTEGKTEDHITDIETFDRSKVDLSWEWRLYSDYTAHGLRAAFVSEHMRFLPPSLIGRHLTGQFSEQLVWYYTIMNAEDIGDHQQLLINLLMKNEDKIKDGGAPELAEKISSMNAIIAKDIDTDPEGAISTHGLFSLSDVDNSKNGIAELKAKKNTQLAFNSTHICPFNNSCPSEVVKKFGLDKPCTVCPYAIRGVMHLPALNAQKFKFVELMEEYGAKIKEYKKRSKTGVIQAEIEGLEAEYDRLTRDAFALEAIEYQLYRMRNAGDQPYIAQDTQTIKDLYETLELDESEHLIKRLIDVQCFPDLDSPTIQRKFARLRYKLMMSTGDVSGLLEDREEPEHALLASQLHSIMSVKELSIRDVFKLASTDVSSKIKPQSVSKGLGFEALKLTLKEGADVE